jgi:hypothetical protein
LITKPSANSLNTFDGFRLFFFTLDFFFGTVYVLFYCVWGLGGFSSTLFLDRICRIRL